MKIKANGIEINYVIEGEGPMVTMSHSLACNLSMWDEQARALRDRYRVLRFDTRGHGQTSAPSGPYSLSQLADDLLGLLKGLGIERTHFVGLSMGGMIGQVFALAHPAMIESLVLCDTTSRYPATATSVWEERIRTVEAQGMAPMVEPTLGRWFTAPFRSQRADVMTQVGAMIRQTPPNGYVGCRVRGSRSYTRRHISPIWSSPRSSTGFCCASSTRRPGAADARGESREPPRRPSRTA
jgi:3-oxoadipate enol-lactonase